MYWKIEPSGCCERKGKVQIRYDFFLDPEDYNFNKVDVEVRDIPIGAKFIGSPFEISLWATQFPKKKADPIFHTHIAYFSSTVTVEEIKSSGDKFSKEAFKFWQDDKFPDLRNTVEFMDTVDVSLKEACESKVSSIKAEVI